METNQKEVYFDIFCPLCIHKDEKETEMPCDECLAQPYNEFSHTPINFEGKV